MSLKSELQEILNKTRGTYAIDDVRKRGEAMEWSLSHTSITDDEATDLILDLLDKSLKEARVDELERLTKHRDFIYWGDGASSDLDKYLADRIKDVL